MNDLTHIDLFSGIGGFSLAAESCGFRTILFCEIDEFCQKILKKHWPETPIVSDIRDIDGTKWRGTTLLTGDSHANRFLKPVSEKAKRMTVISGQKCSVSLNSQDRGGLLLKMLLELSTWHSDRCYLIWNPLDTISQETSRGIQSFRLYQLAVSTPPTGVIEFGLWPTMTTFQIDCQERETIGNSTISEDGRRWGMSVQTYCRVNNINNGKELIPEIGEALMGFPIGWTDIGPKDSKPSETQSSIKSHKK